MNIHKPAYIILSAVEYVATPYRNSDTALAVLLLTALLALAPVAYSQRGGEDSTRTGPTLVVARASTRLGLLADCGALFGSLRELIYRYLGSTD